jgi:hypothetical protein
VAHGQRRERIDVAATPPDGTRFDGVTGRARCSWSHRKISCGHSAVARLRDRPRPELRHQPAVRRSREAAARLPRSSIVGAIVNSTPFTMSQVGQVGQVGRVGQAGRVVPAKE